MAAMPIKLCLYWTGNTAEHVPHLVAEVVCTYAMAYDISKSFMEGNWAGVKHKQFIADTFDRFAFSDALLGERKALPEDIYFEQDMTAARVEFKYSGQ